MERFENIVNGFLLLTVFARRSTFDVRQGSEYTSEICLKKISLKKMCLLNMKRVGQLCFLNPTELMILKFWENAKGGW